MPKPLQSRTKRPDAAKAGSDLPAELPLLPTRDLALFPIMTASLVVGRRSSAESF